MVARTEPLRAEPDRDAEGLSLGGHEPFPLLRGPGPVNDQGVGPEPADHVEVQHRAGLLERHDRVTHVAGGTEEPELLAGERDEDERAVGPGPPGKHPGRRQERGDSGRVVIRPVVDLAVVVRVNAAEAAETQVVVVRPDHDRLVGERGVAPAEQPHHVVARAARRVGVRGTHERNLLEIPAVRACRLEPQTAELLGEVASGAALARASREAAFEGVVREIADRGQRKIHPPGERLHRGTRRGFRGGSRGRVLLGARRERSAEEERETVGVA